VSQAIVPLVFLALTVASWALRPATRALTTIAPRSSTSTRSLHAAVDVAV